MASDPNSQDGELPARGDGASGKEDHGHQKSPDRRHHALSDHALRVIGTAGSVIGALSALMELIRALVHAL